MDSRLPNLYPHRSRFPHHDDRVLPPGITSHPPPHSKPPPFRSPSQFPGSTRTLCATLRVSFTCPPFLNYPNHSLTATRSPPLDSPECPSGDEVTQRSPSSLFTLVLPTLSHANETSLRSLLPTSPSSFAPLTPHPPVSPLGQAAAPFDSPFWELARQTLYASFPPSPRSVPCYTRLFVFVPSHKHDLTTSNILPSTPPFLPL